MEDASRGGSDLGGSSEGGHPSEGGGGDGGASRDHLNDGDAAVPGPDGQPLVLRYGWLEPVEADGFARLYITDQDPPCDGRHDVGTFIEIGLRTLEVGTYEMVLEADSPTYVKVYRDSSPITLFPSNVEIVAIDDEHVAGSVDAGTETEWARGTFDVVRCP